MSPLKILAFGLIALILHLTSQDARLIGDGHSANYLTLHELLLTVVFGFLLAIWAFPLRREINSRQARFAFLFLFCATLFNAWVGTKYLLYPYEFDVIEGNNLLQGLVFWHNPSQLYPNPETGAAVVYLYPPFSGILYGTLYQLSGYQLFYPRLLNFLLVLLSGYFLTRLTKLTKLQAFYIFCSWMFLQTFISGYLYSLRVDGLLVFLLVLACYLFKEFLELHSRWKLLATALVLSLAILTKQHGLFVLAAFVLTLLLTRQLWPAALLITIALAPVLTLSLYVNVITEGWYWKTMTLGNHRAPDSRVFFGFLSPSVILVIFTASIIYYETLRRDNFLKFKEEAWLLLVAACYFWIATAGLMIGGLNSMNNYMFLFAILLPAVWITILPQKELTLIAGWTLLTLSRYYFLTHEYAIGQELAPRYAEEVVQTIKKTDGPILLARRQEFLLRERLPVYDDLGTVYYEFLPAGYTAVVERINQTIRSGKYTLILSNHYLYDQLEPLTKEYVKSHYDLVEHEKRGDLFPIELRKRT